MYCSTQCQSADWEIHSGECTVLAERYRGMSGSFLCGHLITSSPLPASKSNGTWIPVSARNGQLKVLEVMTNRELPSPKDLQRCPLVFLSLDGPSPPLHATPPPSRYGSSISIFENFTVRPDQLIGHQRLDLQSYLQSICVYPQMAVHLHRIERWIRDMEASPGARSLVEGAFRLHHGNSMLVLARMSYSAKAAKGGGYSVLNSIFCPVST
jgi:hypothetical protein